MRELAPRATLLVPGVGTQGGDPAEVVAAARAEYGLMVVNASRSIANAADPGAAARELRDALNAPAS